MNELVVHELDDYAVAELKRNAEDQPAPDKRCKIDGCNRPYASQKGPYGRLCVGHRAEAQAANGRAPKKTASGPAPAAQVGGSIVKAALAYEQAQAEYQARRRALLALLEEKP